MVLSELLNFLNQAIKDGAPPETAIKFVDKNCNKNLVKEVDLKYHVITNKYKVPTIEILLDIPLTADETISPLRITTGTW